MSGTSGEEDAIVVALGSNLRGGFPGIRQLLEAALAGLGAAGATVLARSSWWRSAAWPDTAEPAYLNGVALIETSLDPAALVERLLAVERDFGRHPGPAHAPRTLDLDLSAHGRRVIDG